MENLGKGLAPNSSELEGPSLKLSFQLSLSKGNQAGAWATVNFWYGESLFALVAPSSSPSPPGLLSWRLSYRTFYAQVGGWT